MLLLNFEVLKPLNLYRRIKFVVLTLNLLQFQSVLHFLLQAVKTHQNLELMALI